MVAISRTAARPTSLARYRPAYSRAVLLRKPFITSAIAIGLPALGGAITACSGHTSNAQLGPSSSSSDAGAGAALPTCADGGLSIAFNPIYSAYIENGKHTFQVPAVVFGSDDNVIWSADNSIVGMQKDEERPNEVLLTMLNAGTTTLVVQTMDRKQCGSSVLTVSPADENDWQIGNARYNDGNSVHINNNAAPGSSPLESMGSVGPACTSCHGETATGGPFTNVSHTPEQTGGFSDDDILNIVLHGTFPPNAFFDWSIVMYPNWQMFHQWADIMPDQQKGIITYLRSLTPVVQRGSVNFGYFDMDSGSADAPAQ
jgi:hypothetical protein